MDNISLEVKSQEVEMAQDGEVGKEGVGVRLPEKIRRRCPLKNLKILFAVLSAITSIFAIWTIVVSLSGAVVYQKYSSDQSGRSIGLLLLMVSSFITLAVLISGSIAIFKKKYKCINVVSGVLVVVVVFQAILAGTSVRVSLKNEAVIVSALNQSFQLAKHENTKEHKLWSISQYELRCCGFQSADDYKDPNLPPFFDPKVPISCCPSYNPEESETSQELKRTRCILSRSYYKQGCEQPILEIFQTGAYVTLIAIICLIVLELILAVLAGVIFKNKNIWTSCEKQNKDNEPVKS